MFLIILYSNSCQNQYCEILHKSQRQPRLNDLTGGKSLLWRMKKQLDNYPENCYYIDSRYSEKRYSEARYKEIF